jgi:hypothetical protein
MRSSGSVSRCRQRHSLTVSSRNGSNSFVLVHTVLSRTAVFIVVRSLRSNTDSATKSSKWSGKRTPQLAC